MKPHDESLTKAALLARPFPKMRSYRFDRALVSYRGVYQQAAQNVVKA